MHRPATIHKRRERSVPCTTDEVSQLCEALCRLGYPRALGLACKTALEHACVRHYHKGEVVVREGDEPHEAFVVRSGWLKVIGLSGHRRRVLSEILPGGIVGEMGLLSGHPRTATVKAAVDSDLFVIDEREFAMLLDSSPEFRQRMEGLASEREIGLELLPPPDDD